MSQGANGATQAQREPALDGLRALAVVLVMLFHGGMPWMSGGYLGVSLFFTLSGFLITRLLLDELDRTGTIRVGAFYARRARRLLPASLLCLVGVVLAARADLFLGVAHLRRDLVAALAQIYNWVQLGSGNSYGDLIGQQAGVHSPLDHYWSLAIEEQFYWLWPLALLVAIRLQRRRRDAPTRFVVGAAVATCAAAPLIAWIWGPDAAYWATPARAAEILVGGAAAALYRAGHLQRVPTWLAPLGLAVLVALSATLPSDHGFAYEGGLVIVGLISATVLLALRRPSPTGRVLSWRPLVSIGAVSYGLYLFHWPVYVVLDEARTDLHGYALLALRLAVTTVITLASYALLEQPVRRATWPPARTLLVGTAAMLIGLISFTAVPAGADDYWTHQPDTAAAAITPVGSLAPLEPVTAAVTTIPDSTATAAVPSPKTATAPPTTAAPVSRPVRILVIGDSTAIATGGGLATWAAANPSTAQVSVLATPRCGMVRGGRILGDAPGDEYLATCADLLDRQLAPTVAKLQPDVVAVVVAARDSETREWDPAEGPLRPTDGRYQARIEHDYTTLTQMVVAAAPAAKVAWIRPPQIDPWWKDTDGVYADAEGHAVVDAVTARLSASDPAHARVVDLRLWMESSGLADDHDLRPDGIHFTPDAATQVATEWLGPQLVAVALA